MEIAGVIKLNTSEYNHFDIVVKKQFRPVALLFIDTNFDSPLFYEIKKRENYFV